MLKFVQQLNNIPKDERHIGTWSYREKDQVFECSNRYSGGIFAEWDLKESREIIFRDISPCTFTSIERQQDYFDQCLDVLEKTILNKQSHDEHYFPN